MATLLGGNVSYYTVSLNWVTCFCNRLARRGEGGSGSSLRVPFTFVSLFLVVERQPVDTRLSEHLVLV